MKMNGLEFYMIDSEVWYLSTEGKNERLDESKKEVIAMLIGRIMECYPEAYKALEKCYSKSAMNVPYYRYLIARRFVKCNFGNLDTAEIDCQSSFRFEKVSCPLRGECQFEGVICMPKFNSTLSGKELEVMRLIYEGRSIGDIAEKLYLSPFTVKNHIKSAYAKLGIHEKSEFILYANKNNIFNLKPKSNEYTF